MKTGLILEGGAMRGMFTCGVLDVMLENGISFDAGVGISAGAVFGINFKSRQIGRGIRYNMKYSRDPRYAGFRSLFKTGDYYGRDFCYYEIPDKLDPFDKKAFSENPMEFWIGATDVLTGKCVYHKCTDGGHGDIEWLRASASMPLFSKIVKCDGYSLLDGGVTDPIPFRFAEEIGCERNVAVLTQPDGYTKKKSSASFFMHRVYGKYAEFLKASDKRHIEYNHELYEIKKREKDGKYLVIRPSFPLGIKRIEKKPSELKRVYEIGRKECFLRINEIKEFLNQ